MTLAPGPTLYRCRRILLIACIAAWIASFALTHTPKQNLPRIAHGGTRSHFMGFFALAGMFYLTLAAHGVTPRKRAILSAVILSAYGGFDEITQPLASRTADVFDWFADSTGAVLAAAACHAACVLRNAASAAAEDRGSALSPQDKPSESRERNHTTKRE